MKKFLSLLLITFVCLTSVAMARPVKIARLPIIIQQNKLDAETSAALETKMARAVFILNKEKVNYVPPQKSAQKLQNIWQKMYSQNNNPRFSEALKKLAKDLNAEIVICPVMRNFAPNSVTAELFIFDKKSNSVQKTRATSNDANSCFEELILNSKLRQIIHNYN